MMRCDSAYLSLFQFQQNFTFLSSSFTTHSMRNVTSAQYSVKSTLLRLAHFIHVVGAMQLTMSMDIATTSRNFFGG